MKAATGGSGFAGHLLAVCLFALMGWASELRANPSEFIPAYWKPQLLYLEANPYAEVYVELDSVEGCQPSAAAVRKLGDFLATYCDKPGGVHLVPGAVIPRKAALGVAPQTLADKYMIGPPPTKAGPQPAFMCILFYDSLLSQESAAAETNHADRNGGAGSSVQGLESAHRHPAVSDCLHEHSLRPEISPERGIDARSRAHARFGRPDQLRH